MYMCVYVLAPSFFFPLPLGVYPSRPFLSISPASYISPSGVFGIRLADGQSVDDNAKALGRLVKTKQTNLGHAEWT